ncbi:MAG: hypothetical protein ABL982_03920 [Vicinamibacterales bacterium]
MRGSSDADQRPGASAPPSRHSAGSAAKGTAQLLAANVTSNALAAARGLLMARGMSPDQFGVWSLMASALGYANYVDFGLNTGYLLTAAGQAARGEAEQVRRTAAQVLVGSVTLSVIVASVVCVVPMLAAPLWSVRHLAIVLSVALLASSLSNYFSATARLDGAWHRIAGGSVIGAVATTLAIAALAFSGGLTALSAGAATVGGIVLTAAALGWRLPLPFEWPPDRDLLGRILLAGGPVIAMPVAILLFQNLDRWIVATVVTPGALGTYGLGATLGGFLYLIPGPLAIVLFTRQIGTHAVSADVTATRHLVLPPLHALSSFMALIAGAVVIALPVLATRIAPAYGGLGLVAVCHVIGNCLLFSGPVASQYLAAVGRTRGVLTVLAAAMATEAVLVVSLLKSGAGITGAAVAVLASDLFYGVGLVTLCVSLFHSTVRERSRVVAGFFVPFVISLSLALLLFTLLTPVPGRTWLVDVTRLVWVELLYLVVAGAGLLTWSRTTGLLTHPLVAGAFRRYAPSSIARLLLGPVHHD